MKFLIPNMLSLTRGALVVCFFQLNMMLRVWAIILAIITDILDGYIARKYGSTSRYGAVLDPLMDRIFVIVASCVLITESQMTFPQMTALITRDFIIFGFGFFLLFSGGLFQHKLESLWTGKITTASQLILLLCLVGKVPVPFFIFDIFIILGIATLIELSYRYKVFSS